ncbi:MAG TPA: rhomboid family intramembrane serine protease [Burkholderiales bacterium]|jgi:membrane associated rhomboid family serine protease|nr:rhomboid family intramembrane serine protease [Burkholderiales bacterium]
MFYSIPTATRALIIANIAMFGAQALVGDALIVYLGLWPINTAGNGLGFAPWQLVTYSFLHGNMLHLFFNMFALYMFGGELERLFGPKRYLNLYFLSVIAAAITQLVFSAIAGGEPYPTVGASGGVFGLLLAYGMYFPTRMVMLLFPPIPMPAPVFVAIYGALELYLGVTGTQQGVAHFAHLGGMFGAWLLIRYWRGRFPFRNR